MINMCDLYTEIFEIVQNIIIKLSKESILRINEMQVDHRSAIFRQ